MALTFPSNPINGATSGDYTYDSTKTAWRKNGAYPVSVTHSDVAPSNPRAGDQWWKSNEGTLFTYYYDGDSYQWVESTNVVANVEPNPIPAGAMMAWGSDIIPANWLLCDGSAVSRSTYASLFAAVGTQYGAGDGTTTFNLPNLKGRTIVGKDSTQTEFDVLGETGGAKTHTLTTAEMPSHTHTNTLSSNVVASSTHAHGASSMIAGLNIFRVGGETYFDYNERGGGFTENARAYLTASGTVIGGRSEGAGSGVAVYGDTDAANATTTVGITNAAAGSGGAHNNLQPYIVLNYIIKYSAGETPGDSQLAVRVGTLETQKNLTPLSQNYLINGAYDIWQRGTSFSAAGYTADRWNVVTASGQTVSVSQQAFTPGAAPVAGYEGTYHTRVAWSGTPSGYFWYNQKVEDVRTLAGQTATLSFWAKASTATSALNSTIELNMGSGGSGGVTLNGSALSLTTSWARYSTTFTLPSMSGKTIGTSSYLDVRLLQGASTVNGINIDIWGAQLEAGSYATPFRRNAPSIQSELAACQRYYVRFTGGTPYGNIGQGFTFGGSYSLIIVPLPVEMRVAPTSSEYSTLRVYDSSVAVAVTNVTLNSNFNTSKQAGLTVDGGTVTVNRPALLQGNNNINYYLGLSAEL